MEKGKSLSEEDKEMISGLVKRHDLIGVINYYQKQDTTLQAAIRLHLISQKIIDTLIRESTGSTDAQHLLTIKGWLKEDKEKEPNFNKELAQLRLRLSGVISHLQRQ